MRYPHHLIKLIQVLKKLPGVGNKSAERFAFQLLSWSDVQLKEFGQLLATTKENLTHCHHCGCLVGNEGCLFCENPLRETDKLCIIASPRDVYSIEETNEYKGLYHVLGGLLSPLDQKGPEHLSIHPLKLRINQLQVKEVVIALDSTLEGDATSLYLKQELASDQIEISRLAFGIPIGSSLDYVDGGTLARAFSCRHQF
jgi:recombination protein RecR